MFLITSFNKKFIKLYKLLFAAVKYRLKTKSKQVQNTEISKNLVHYTLQAAQESLRVQKYKIFFY